MKVRQYEATDARRVWALNNIPNVGETADEAAPLDLPRPDRPPTAFPLLADIEKNFLSVRGDFLVVEDGPGLVGMGGIRPNTDQQAEVLHIRVHPARRRLGVGQLVMTALEDRARALGYVELHLDTASNQPDAVAFYKGLGYTEVGTETQPEWHWTLVYFTKQL